MDKLQQSLETEASSAVQQLICDGEWLGCCSTDGKEAAAACGSAWQGADYGWKESLGSTRRIQCFQGLHHVWDLPASHRRLRPPLQRTPPPRGVPPASPCRPAAAAPPP